MNRPLHLRAFRSAQYRCHPEPAVLAGEGSAFSSPSAARLSLCFFVTDRPISHFGPLSFQSLAHSSAISWGWGPGAIRYPRLPTHAYELPCPPPTIFPLFSYSYKLLAASKNANSPIFSYFQTLSQKHPGWGEGPASTDCSALRRANPMGNPYVRFGSPLPTTSCARLNGEQPLNYTSGWRIGRILGIPIYLHASWVLVFALITYSLKMGLAERHPSWTLREQWTVGVLTSLLFFCSVLFHELSHSVVAQHYKIRVVSITLFLFGGLARIGREPPKAIQEFNIAVAGPLASFFLYGVFLSITIFFPGNEMLGALAGWLSYINLRLAVFNLLPGFPLDGGRIFRAIVWHYTKDFPRATRIAGASGRLVAYGVMLYGASFAFKGDWASGGWLAFI